jgi:DNA-binding CsgD family transcriptional regulator
LIHPATPPRAGSESVTPLDTNAFGLSVPEVAALMHWAEGFSDEEAATLRGISAQEVVAHVQAGCQKMGTVSRTAACVRALKTDLIV